MERALIISRGKPLRFDDLIYPAVGSNTENFEIPDRQPVLLDDDVITRRIRDILNITKGKVGGISGAVKLMGVNPATLRHRMRKLGILFGRNVHHH